MSKSPSSRFPVTVTQLLVTRNDDKAKHARKALEVIEPRWQWIWKRCG